MFWPRAVHVVLVEVRFHDRVHRAGFLAEPAEDALEQVDVVARGAAGAVGALFRIDGDRQRGAHGLAQLARDAALLAVRIAAQRVQAAEARRLRRLFHRVHTACNLGRNRYLPGQEHALGQLDEQQTLEVGDGGSWSLLSRREHVVVRQQRRRQKIHAMVIGMKTFQPRRMIWS